MKDLHSLVRENIDNYISGNTKTGKYVDFNLYETIETIDAYKNSKHISGSTDHLGREKPFFNIVNAASNIWYRATDIDRKDIRIKAKKIKQTLMAFIANLHLQDFMTKSNFGSFLNKWGKTLADYGSAVVKFVEKDGQLNASVVAWNRIICDSVDFYSDLVIEKLYYTPAQLRQNKSYDQDIVESLIKAQGEREQISGEKIDSKSNFIEVYEVHGLMPNYFLTDDEKDEENIIYSQQMHVISFVEKKESKKGDEYENFTLIKGREAKSPYMITHLIEEDGQVLGKGAIQHLFDAQWMVNHSQKLIKDQLDLASKLIFQTSDPSFVGQNALVAIENGDILTHTPNSPLTQIANNSHDITSLQNFGTIWQQQAKEITSTPDALSGNTMPSGTAYRQVAVLNQEAHSLFEMMVENKGLYLEEMIREFVIPYIKKKMDTKDEISATLSAHDIQKIDPLFIDNTAIKIKNDIAVNTILSGKLFEGANLDEIKSGIKNGLSKLGNDRYFIPDDIDEKTWKDLLEEFEWDAEVEITNENSNKESTMTSLTTLFQAIISKQGQPFTPEEKLLFNKIIEQTGAVSTIELSSVATEVKPQETMQTPESTPQNTVDNLKQIPTNLPTGRT